MTDMRVIGRVDSVWRYPVKSMAGEALEQAFVGFAGVYGDRLYAFRSSKAIAGFPYLTAREQKLMLRCRPRFRHPEKAVQPPNLSEAESLAPGVTPIYADPSDLMVDVETPTGRVLAVDDPDLIALLVEGSGEAPELTLLRSDRALTDCRPVSVFSLQTAQALGDVLNLPIDKRRFRANIYVDFKSGGGFVENDYLGRRLRIGTKAEISILERDPRCKMITLDPDTGESNPKILRPVAQDHDGKAGVYGAVLVEGTVRPGDDVVTLD